jgi:phosphate transport system substrate-binding protein
MSLAMSEVPATGRTSMGKKPTDGASAATAAFVCLWLGACSHREPNPKEIARALPARESLPDSGTRPACAEAWPLPAPAVETAPRHPEPAPRAAVLAVGHSVAALLDPTFQSGLETAFPELGRELKLEHKVVGERDAVDLMLTGKVDAAIVGGPLSQREISAGLRQFPIGYEVFALAVSRDVQLQTLANWQVRALLTGKVRHWGELGSPAGDVNLVLPLAETYGERAARALINGDALAARARRVSTDREIFDQLLRTPGSVGIVRLASTGLDPTARLLAIDGVMPGKQNYLGGNYPFALTVNLVSAGEPVGVARKVLDFARSDAGRQVLGRHLALP